MSSRRRGSDTQLYRGGGIRACIFWHRHCFLHKKSTAAALLSPHLHLSPAHSLLTALALVLIGIPACLRFPPCARQLSPGLNYLPSQQFISTGGLSANWKTCTLATIHNEWYRKYSLCNRGKKVPKKQFSPVVLIP